MSPLSNHAPILLLLQPAFEDPEYPGQIFFCRHGQLLEGVLASFPQLREQLQVRHVPFARPRAEVVALVGEDDQTLPKLVLPSNLNTGHASGENGGRQYVSGTEAILATLAELYHIPVAHP